MNSDQTPKTLTEEEKEQLLEAEYWHQRAMEESDYFAHLAQLQEREE